MKVGIITFHASHNYGSMLQAYALQQTVLALGFDCKIINLRTRRQKIGFRPFFRTGERRNKIVALRHPLIAIADVKKHRLFELFIKHNYQMTEQEYVSSVDIKENPPTFDFYISGSDQIWNTGCFDFEEAYYLDFVRTGKRIAYAPSMGPKNEVEVSENFNNFIIDNIKKYDTISVRESQTARKLRSITGLDFPTMLDPTLLISKPRWMELAGNKRKVKEKYILLYTPWYDEYVYSQAEKLGGQFKLKVVCTMAHEVEKWPDFRFIIDVGPIEFINLVMNAAMVVTASFHAVIFAIIFGRPFYAVNGMEDNRISHILSITGLERMSAPPGHDYPAYDSEQVMKTLDPLISESINFIKNSLEL